MKKVTNLFLTLLLLLAGNAWGSTVTIGTGTLTQIYPLGNYYGYERSASLYTAAEMTTAGTISQLNWYATVARTANIPMKIYLKETTSTALTAATWASLTTGATLVFDATNATITANAWNQFILSTTFVFGGSNNLLVLVEANYGGSGTGGSAGTAVRYTTATSGHMYVRGDGSPPAGNGTVTSNRPNIQFEIAAIAPTLPPNCALITSPANAATGVVANASLKWASGGGFPDGYYLYFGTDNPPTNIVNGTDVGNVTTFTPASPFAYSTTYYWQVVAYNVVGSATGCSVWSFTTMADPSITALPYSESFDGTTFAPVGWTNIKVAGTGTPGIWDRQTAGTYPTCSPHSGAAMLRYNCYGLTGGTTGALISPPVNVADPVVQAKLWMYRDAGYPSNADKVEVYTNTAANVTGATLLGTINRNMTLAPAETGAGWYEYTFNITNSGKGIFYVIIQGVSAYGNNMFIDDFSLELPPACMPPSNLTTTDITTTSAILGWTENGTATSWNIETGLAGFTPTGTPTASGVTNPYLLSGLSAGTSYAFYVQADCGPLSTWAGPFVFKTVNGVPFFDGFETGNTHNVAIAGWTQQAVLGTGIWTANNTLTTYNRTPKTGGWNAFLQYSNTRWMFTGVQLTGGVKYAFSMFARQDVATGATLTVSYGNAANAAAMVNPIIAETIIVNGDYQQLLGVFTPAADGIYYIGIKGSLTSSPWYVSIDDISIEEAPAPGYLAGVVTDVVSGNPLAGVTVTAMPGGVTDVTDALGNYSLELDLGMYELTFDLSDYYQTTISGILVESGLTTFQNAILAPVPPPDCSELVFPPDNQGGVLPYQPLQWVLPVGSAPANGYRLLLYNITDDVWLVNDQENGDDIGNVTEYLPTGGWDWGKDYVWLVFPYNNSGAPEACIPWYFTTPFTGVFEGMVTEAVTGVPLGDVKVKLTEILPHAGLTFEATTAADGSWTFEFESGIYNIVYEKYGYVTLSTPLQTLQTLQTVQLAVQMVPEVPYAMPFTETWSSGSYGTQKWMRTSPSNWGLVLDGNPGPSAIFYWDPEAINYNMQLKSHFIDATNETKVYVQFDLLLDNYDWDYLETMQFEVYDGTAWHVVEAFDNYWGSIPWQTNTYDISDLVADGLFQIGFRAEGESTFNINWWLLDNIIVTNKLFEVQPESIHDILFAGESIDYDIDIKNFGLGGIGWNAQIVPANAAMSLSQMWGTVLPGTQTITLTLDADAIAPGVYESEVIITDDDGIFVESVLVHFEVTDQSGQKIMIPERGQWGYISTYIGMNAKASVDVVMADIADDMVIMLGKTGIFWPEFNINTIGEYDTYQGYKLKMAADAALAFYGNPVENKTVSFNTGTFIVPVLSQNPILATTVFGGQPVEFAFGLDGTIYWPYGGIYTLEELIPGYGYLVRFSAPATLDFNVAKSSSLAFNKPASRVNYTTWNDVNYTGDVHIIGVSADAASELLPGDVVGIFNADGQCTGMALYNGDNKAFALAAYADDPTTIATDGMLEGETLQVKIFRDNETIDVQPAYNRSMPDYSGTYVINGLTMISSFKAGATSIGDVTTTTFAVYPNPTTGIITIDGITSTTKVMVTNTQGQIISNISIDAAHQLDLSSQPSGLYFVKLVSDQGTKTVKLVVR